MALKKKRVETIHRGGLNYLSLLGLKKKRGVETIHWGKKNALNRCWVIYYLALWWPSSLIYDVYFVWTELPVATLPCLIKNDIISLLTLWGRVTHICVSKLTIIGSDNGLSPERRQAIIWTNAGILLIGPLGTNVSEILIEIQTFSLKKIRLKMLSAKCCSFRLSLNVLTHWGWVMCFTKLTIICSNNGLSPGRCQAIIWTNAGILVIRTIESNLSEIFVEIHTFSFKKMHWKMSSGKWQPFCLSLNVLMYWSYISLATAHQYVILMEGLWDLCDGYHVSTKIFLDY